eukprot:jgi/Chlat1/1253/Chrsp115S01694
MAAAADRTGEGAARREGQHGLKASSPVSSKSAATKRVVKQESVSVTQGTPQQVVRGGTGRRAAMRQGARELHARMQKQGGQQGDEDSDLFEMPSEISEAFGRNFAFLQRVFSPESLFQPLPPALRQSMLRNFSFFTRIFTQFIDPNQAKEVRESIPGLAGGRRR